MQENRDEVLRLAQDAADLYNLYFLVIQGLYHYSSHVESLFMNKKNKLLHGEAIAIGMICESYISCKINGLEIDKANEIKNHLNKFFSKVSFSKTDIDEICNLIKYDKKNHLNIPKFVLLKNVGLIEIDVNVDVNLIADSFDYYTV